MNSHRGDEPADVDERAALLGLSAETRGFLRALASDTRLDLLLLFAEGDELSVGQVVEYGGLAPSTTSEQLAILRRGGLLTARRDGKQVRYRADRDGIIDSLQELTAFLRRCC